ncbi:MAG: molybdenum cofactor guanylyltransferase [Bacillota bacterium]
MSTGRKRTGGPAPAAAVTGLLLAGGSSSRMGFSKAVATLGGETLVARAARLLADLTGTVLIVSRDRTVAEGLPYRVVDSEVPGVGPLAALAAGLRECRTPWALALACDLPLFPAGLAVYMLEVASSEDGWQAVVPRWNGFWEPLAALYAPSCLAAIEEALARGERRLASFYPRVRVRPVEEREIRLYAPPQLAFFNVNSPEDLARLRGLGQFVKEQGQHASGGTVAQALG